MSRDKFHKRSGTTDQGKEYENLLVAYYSLQLVLNHRVLDYKISSNDDKYGNFDDLVVHLTFRNGSFEQFNIQAKHKQANKNKNLLIEALKAESGKFSIRKRFEEFKEKPSRHFKLILFTNRKLEVDDDEEVIREENFAVCITHHQTHLMINTANDQNSVYKFYVRTDNANITDNKKVQNLELYKKFCNNFYLCTNQKNVSDVRDAISALFQDNFKCGPGPVKNYVEFVYMWCNTDGKKDKLTKRFVQLKIAECLLSPYVLVPSDAKETEKSNLFKLAVNAFDVTVVHNPDNTDFYRINLATQVDLEILNKTGLKYQVIPKYVKNIREIYRLQRAIILWLLNECPLIVKVTQLNEDSVFEAIDLCQKSEEKRKFILLGSRKNFFNWKTFYSLSDLYHNNKELYDIIVTTYSCSFHGQRETYLADIIGNDEKIRSVFSTDELTLMIDDSYNFGGPKESLPDYYIERRLTKIIIDYNFVEKFGEVNTIVISCNGKINILKNRFQDVNFLMIDDSDDNSGSPTDNSTEFFSKHNIFLARNQCSKEAYGKIREKFPSSTCHHFQINENNNLEWIESSKIDNLKLFVTGEQHIKENSISDLESLNIICADAGMGKSMMMSNLKNNYSSNLWVAKILLREHVNFFEKNTDYQKFLRHVFGVNNLTQFERRIFDIFHVKGNLVLIWDGLDEVAKEVLDNVLEMIEKIQKLGMTQWITARTNLKKILEERLNVFARQIKPFGERDIQTYVKKRLHFVKDLDKLTQLILEKIDNEHLRVPLQIFMLTELYYHNDKLCTKLMRNTFSVTELFQHFVDEKFNFYYKKANIDISNNVARQIIQEHKAQRVECYQRVALDLCLPPTILPSLKLPSSENFLFKIQTENDVFGILEVINNVPNFVHRTYAEYFVALWLSENYTRISNLETFFFEENFKGVRFMFDLIMAKECPLHIAVLHKSTEEVRKHLDKLDLEDRAGRSPLHIASSWGEAHPVLSTEDDGTKVSINAERGFAPKGDNLNHKLILEVLVTKCNIEQKDKLFQYDCLQYADQSLSLASIDIISKFHQTDLQQLQNFKSLASVFYYIIKLDYINLCKSLTEVPYVETNAGMSLLHLCASLNRQHFLQKLLTNKMYKRCINKRVGRNWAPIHHAVRSGHLDMVKKLKQIGGDIHLGAKTGEDTPLFVAAQYGQLEVLKYLLGNKVNANVSKKNGGTPLMVACQKQNLPVIKMLLEYGADVNMANSEGYSPLYVVARKGNLQLVNYLLSKNAKVNLVGKNGEGPLYIAAKLGHLRVVKVLLQKNADVNVVKSNGWTPLMVAIDSGHIPVVKLLLDNKALTNSPPTIGSMFTSMTWKPKKIPNPLIVCAKKGNLEIAKMLLQYGAAVNEDNDQKPLYSAVCCGHLQMVKLLTEYGAEVTVEVVRLAAKLGYYNIRDLLLENINETDRKVLFPITEMFMKKRSTTRFQNRMLNRTKVLRFVSQSRFPEVVDNKKKKWTTIIVLILLVVVAVLLVSSSLNYLIDVKLRT